MFCKARLGGGKKSDSACEQRLTLAEARRVRQCCVKVITQEERKSKIICERDLLENETRLYLYLIKICFCKLGPLILVSTHRESKPLASWIRRPSTEQGALGSGHSSQLA